MRHLDLSFEGRHIAERDQLDNGKLPHGGHKGSKRHPPCILSYDKGREFQQSLNEEIEKAMEAENITRSGSTPGWSILIHREPSYTDESPLITRSLLAASKHEQINGVNMYNRESLLPNKCKKPLHPNGAMYYRPNRLHQYLSATELKNSAKGDVNIMYGRPTRTTLLRARQRSNSAPSNQYEKRRENAHKMDEIRTFPVAQNTSYLRLRKEREGESLHSYLTGARYNRANCLDSKSVEHTGIFMPRHNPALGSFFTGPKGQEFLQRYDETPRDPNMPVPPTPPPPPSPQSGKRRPMTAPAQGRRSNRSSTTPSRTTWEDSRKHPGTIHARSADRTKYKYLRLNVVGSRLPIGGGFSKDSGMKLPSLQGPAGEARSRAAVDEMYRANQPPPTPTTGVLQARAMAILDVAGKDDTSDGRSPTERVTTQNDVQEDASAAASTENTGEKTTEAAKFDQLIVEEEDKTTGASEPLKKDPDIIDPKLIESMVSVPTVADDDAVELEEGKGEKEEDGQNSENVQKVDENVDSQEKEIAEKENIENSERVDVEEIKEETKENLGKVVDENVDRVEGEPSETVHEEPSQEAEAEEENKERIGEEGQVSEETEVEKEEAEESGKDTPEVKEVRFFITEEGGEKKLDEVVNEDKEEDDLYDEEEFEQEDDAKDETVDTDGKENKIVDGMDEHVDVDTSKVDNEEKEIAND